MIAKIRQVGATLGFTATIKSRLLSSLIQDPRQIYLTSSRNNMSNGNGVMKQNYDIKLGY